MHILASRLIFFCVLIRACILERLSFLTAVKRLSITNYKDYYFSCTVVGNYIQWEYNHDPLSAFLLNDVGQAVLDERADYTYTATLLSSQPTMDDEAEMDSVLVISFRNGSNPGNFSVTCISNSNTSTAFFQHNIISTVKNTAPKDADIQLDYVVSEQIVRRGPQYLSHIFICGVHQAPQFIEVTELTLNFSSSDNVGQARTFFSDDRNTATVQGILMARDNLISIALIIVSLEASVVNVTCYDRENIVK